MRNWTNAVAVAAALVLLGCGDSQGTGSDSAAPGTGGVGNNDETQPDPANPGTVDDPVLPGGVQAMALKNGYALKGIEVVSRITILNGRQTEFLYSESVNGFAQAFEFSGEVLRADILLDGANRVQSWTPEPILDRANVDIAPNVSARYNGDGNILRIDARNDTEKVTSYDAATGNKLSKLTKIGETSVTTKFWRDAMGIRKGATFESNSDGTEKRVSNIRFVEDAEGRVDEILYSFPSNPDAPFRRVDIQWSDQGNPVRIDEYEDAELVLQMKLTYETAPQSPAVTEPLGAGESAALMNLGLFLLMLNYDQ